MPDVLVRDLDTPVLAQLKKRAKQHHRSLQAELKLILTDAATDELSFEEAVRLADQLRQKYAGKTTGDSTEIIRAHRDA